MHFLAKLSLFAATVTVVTLLAAVPAAEKPVARETTVVPHDRTRLQLRGGPNASVTLPNGQVRPVASLLNITRPMRFGDYVWNDGDVPEGATWVRIDLARQTLSVFRAEQEIGAAVILYGTDGKPTPSGMFPILEKSEHHRSNLYDADMPFMLRLTYDGVAIHASNVRQGSATHGCIGIPHAFARLLFAQVRRGDIVAILPAAPLPVTPSPATAQRANS